MSRELTKEGSDTAAASLPEPRPAPQPEAPDAPRPVWQRAAVVVGGPLLASAAAVTILVTQFDTAYLINDDAAIAAIARGDYTGKGSSSLVVAPAMFGHVLRLGYGLFPHLPWYGIALYALQIVAWTAIGTAIFTLRRRPPIAERIVVAAIILALAPWMILRPSYTPTSLLLGVAGIIVFAVAAKVPGRVGTIYAVAGGLLLGTVNLLRTSSFVAVVIVFAPVLVVIAVKAGFRRSAACAVTVGVLLVVGFGTNRLEYSRSAEWRDFKKMNSARGWLHDTPRLYDENVSDPDLRRIGWTRNDLRLFATFLYPDPNVFTDRDIRTLATLSPPIRNDISPGHIYDVLVRYSSDRAGDRGPALASLVIVGVLLALRRNRTTAVLTVVSVVWFVGVLVTLLLYVRLPGRVLIPLEAGAALIATVVPTYLTPSRPRTRAGRPWTSAVVVALVALLAAGPAWHGVRNTSRISHQSQRGVRASRDAIGRLAAFDPKGVFVGRGDLIGRWAQPLTTSSPFGNPRLVPLGWTTNSPLFTARIARLGIDDLYTALRTNPHVYLIAFQLDAMRIARFYREHHSGRVRLVARMRHLPVFDGSRIRLFAVFSVLPAPRTTSGVGHVAGVDAGGR
jgi:hypothetical protein